MPDTGRGNTWAPLDFRALPTDAPSGLFDTLFDESDAGLMILDLKPETQSLTISDANLTFERWTGTNRYQLRGQSFFSLFDPAERDSGITDLRQAIAALQPVEARLCLAMDNGPSRSFLVRVRPVGQDHRLIRFLVTFRLASEIMEHALREAQHDREQALQSRDAFLQRMNHDLRTPLNGILGFSDLMKRELLGPLGQEQYRMYVEDIHSAGRELLGRLDDLLAVKETAAAPLEANECVFDPTLMLSDCLESVEAMARGRRHVISSSIAPGLARLKGDLPAIRRMVCALLTNAITASPPAGVVEIAFGTNHRGELTLQVFDDGPVVSTADVDAAIGRFGETIPDVYSSPCKRSSVGLALVKAVIERHQGRLEAGTTADAAAPRSCLSVSFPPSRLVTGT